MRRLSFAAIVVAVCVPLFAATEPNPSARQRELIEKLLVLSKMDQSAPAVMDAMFAQIQKQYLDEAARKGNDPDDVAEARDLFESFRAGASKIDFDGLLHESFVRIYARHFTEQELADLVAFYATPTGQKSIEVMPQLMTEGMQAAAEHISPKVEAVMAQAAEEQEKKRPWRRTMSDIRRVATALEAFMLDNDEQYPAGDYASLKALLSPDYLDKFPEKDMWGHSYAYVVSDDRQHYRIISGGADQNFEWDSRRIVPAKAGEEPAVRYRERLEDDIIFADLQFIQAPVQAKPKGEE
jgi:hypothetical protein